MYGSVLLSTFDPSWRKGETCAGSGGYDDMREGAQVVIRDGDGTRVGLGYLSSGDVAQPASSCRFYFEVEDVPSGGGIYSVEVAQRGEVAFREEEARDLDLTLGDES